MARTACAFLRQLCMAQVLVESGVLQHGGAGHAAQLTSEGVCHSTTVESEEAVRMRVSCAGLKRACHTQWDWRPSWSRGCVGAPLPRDLQRSGQRLLSQLGQFAQAEGPGQSRTVSAWVPALRSRDLQAGRAGS